MLLDIITITKNDYEGLKRTISSTRQLRKVSEIRQIVIDSSDDEARYKNERLAIKEKIEYFWVEPKGVAKAFNYGMRISSARWIWYLNGGDEYAKVVDPNLLVNYLNIADSEIIVFDVFVDNKRVYKPYFDTLIPPVYNWVPHPSTIMLREKLVSANGFDESFSSAMDGDLWMRLLNQNSKVDLISVPLSNFYTGGLSSNKSISGKEVKMVIRKNFKKIFSVWISMVVRCIQAWIYFDKVERK